MTRRLAAFLLCVAQTAVAALAQTPPAGQPNSTITVTTSVARDGTRYQYEISQERGSGLPQWDPRATPDPPLSINEARKAAEAWLISRAPEINAFELSSLGLFRLFPRVPLTNCGMVGCWYYRMTFDLVAGGRRLPSGGDFTVIVLHDGSIVEPRPDTAVTAAPGAGQSPGPIPGPGGVYRVGNGVTPPRAIRQANAEYTDAAMRAKIAGTVTLECVVKTDGTVGDVRVVKSLDAVYGLDEEAIKTARRWRFTPGTVQGRPVPVLITLEMSFNLR